MTFEKLVRRIEVLRCYGEGLESIHDLIVGTGQATEEMFFLAYQATFVGPEPTTTAPALSPVSGECG